MDRIAGAQASGQRIDHLALGAALLAPMTWGLTGVFVQWLHGVPAPAIILGRLLIAGLALAPWALHRRGFLSALRSPLAATMGAYYICATEAFARAPMVDVTLIIGSAPVIAIVLERLRGLRPVRQQGIGAVVAVTGLLCFLRPGHIGTERLLGFLFASGASFALAAYAVGLSAAARPQAAADPLLLALAACAHGTLASLLLLCLDPPTVLAMPSTPHLFYFVLLGIVSTAVPTLAFGVASVRLPSVLTTSLGVTRPLFAALFAGLLLDEWSAPAVIPGALVAILGLLIVLRAPERPPRPPHAP